MNIKQNIAQIIREIPAHVHLVVVTKYATLKGIEEALNCGVKDLGFNSHVQMAALNKLILKNYRSHFIGHIQTNKAKKILMEKPYLIQSVDSMRLAKKLNRYCEELKMVQDILIEIKTDEGKEHGFAIDDWENILKDFENKFKNLRVRGFMTIPPQVDAQNLEVIFSEMKKIFDDSERVIGRKLDYLSMGMSGDYRLAVKSGANMIRVGRKIFS